MLVGAGAEAQEFRNGSIQPPKRVRVIPFLLGTQLIARGRPARAATEIALAIECQYGGVIERGSEIRGGGQVRAQMDDRKRAWLADQRKG